MGGEESAVVVVARLMELAARTAPKGKGTDVLVTQVISGDELGTLARAMRAFGEERGFSFFLRDAGNIEDSDACLLIGAKGRVHTGLNCGGCGYATCEEMIAAPVTPAQGGIPFSGPNCVIRMADIGIALGSAVKTASIHNVDNRIMYSGGVGALMLGWLEGCTVAYAVPLKASGKNIFFDRTH
ncbi:MAG: DUF2148 domain-containing protein [Methanomicrobiaceae archaeon]|nr:DUF2148 domain-containing protein [Methanomicrobiaceae archaeon]